MADEKKTELGSAPTQQLPAIPAQQDDPKFAAEQQRITDLIESDAPLHQILSEVVLMIEAQSPEMLCSILLLSDDGTHVRHAVAPSLAPDYVQAIDGGPIGPKHGSGGTGMVCGKTAIAAEIENELLWG